MRLIDADALRELREISYHITFEDIDAAPTVCCGGCAYFHKKVSECSLTGQFARPDGSCAYFERRTP